MPLVELLVPFCAARVGAHVEADVDRSGDRSGVAPDLRAPFIEDRAFALPFGRREVWRVPAIGESGRGAERAAFARSADPERQALLARLRIVRCVDQPVVRAGEIRSPPIEQQPQDLRVLLELVLALFDRRKWDSVGSEFDLIPTRAEAAVRPAARELIDRAHRLREYAGVAVSDAEHQAANANACRLHGDGGHGRDRLEAVALAALRRGLLEMIGDREPSEATP